MDWNVQRPAWFLDMKYHICFSNPTYYITYVHIISKCYICNSSKIQYGCVYIVSIYTINFIRAPFTSPTHKACSWLFLHCKNRIVNMTCSLSFWLQMSEPITHIDTDNCMTIHHKGTSYFHFTAHLFTPLKEMISYHSL